MEYITIGIVFLPLFLSLMSLFLRQNKVSRILIQSFAIFFFLSAIHIFTNSVSTTAIPVPSVVWKFVVLSIIVAFFIQSVKVKHYGIAIFFFIQSVLLIITEITVSLKEPTPFLLFDHKGKLIFLFGAFITAAFIPVLIRYMDKYTLQMVQKKQIAAGIFLLMSAFAGIVAAESLTGLFLFWQLGFGANALFIKAFGKYEEKNYRIIAIIQQIILTTWLIVNAAIYFSRGFTKIADIIAEAGSAAGLIVAISLITAIVLGFLVPERHMLGAFFVKPIPFVGLSSIILSLLSQFAVLLKLGPLFSNLGHDLLSLIVLLGAFIMAAAAYYAAATKNAGEIFAYMVVYFFGWGLATAFTGKESLFFTTGYIAVAALTMAFLFCSIIAIKYVKGTQDVERMRNLINEMPFLTVILSTGMTLFLFAPFYTSLQKLVFVRLMVEYPISMLFMIASLAFVTTVIFNWLTVILFTGQQEGIKKYSLPVVFKIILPVLYLPAVGVNLLTGSIYQYFQHETPLSSLLPAKDLEKYTGLDGYIYLFRPGTGSLYLWLALIVLTVLFVFFAHLSKGKIKKEKISTEVLCQYSLTAWLPKTVGFENIIRIVFIVIVLLIVGVSLSCLN